MVIILIQHHTSLSRVINTFSIALWWKREDESKIRRPIYWSNLLEYCSSLHICVSQ